MDDKEQIPAIDNSQQSKVKWLQAEAAKRRQEKFENFRQWSNELPPERREFYDQLRVFNSDSKGSREEHLIDCWKILEIIDKMVGDSGKKVIPQGLAIHGSTPIVFVQAQGHETHPGENLNEIFYYSDSREFRATFNTTEYGIPSSRKEIGEDMYSRDYIINTDVSSNK